MTILIQQMKIAKSHFKEDNNKNQRSLSRDIKDRMKKAITEPNIEGDPTRS